MDVDGELDPSQLSAHLIDTKVGKIRVDKLSETIKAAIISLCKGLT